MCLLVKNPLELFDIVQVESFLYLQAMTSSLRFGLPSLGAALSPCKLVTTYLKH